MLLRQQLNVNRVSVLYGIIKKFNYLTPLQQFNVGLELELIAPEDAYDAPDKIVESIVAEVYRTNKYISFILQIERVKRV